MNKTARIFASHAEAARADREYYASLTPGERLAIQLQLIAQHEESTGAAAEGFARVYRIVELARS